MKLIEVDDDGVYWLTGEAIDQKQSTQEYVIQIIILTLLNTPRTNVEFPELGGGVYAMLSQNQRPLEEIATDLAGRIALVEEIVKGVDPGDSNYIITAVSLRRVTRVGVDKVLTVEIDVQFRNAIPITFLTPLETQE